MQHKNKELEQLLNVVQSHKKISKTKVAESIGYSRGHISNALSNKVDAKLVIDRIKVIYSDVLDGKQRMPAMDTDKLIKENLAYSKVILGAVAELLAKDGQLPIASVIEKLNRAIAEEKKHLG